MSNITTNQHKKILTVPVAIIIAGLVIGGAVLYANRSQSGVDLPEKPEAAQPALSGGAQPQKPLDGFVLGKEDHVRGGIDAPITIVEYSDFQCPYCQRFHPTMRQILKDYPEQVRWVYRHFPLDFHQQAQSAAEASECASEQGKFWEFADALFENQPRLGKALYVEAAKDIALNVSQFEDCLSSRKYKEHVEKDYQEGVQAGVSGTPGSFVNGEKIPGAVPYDYLKDSVERALAGLE